MLSAKLSPAAKVGRRRYCHWNIHEGAKALEAAKTPLFSFGGLRGLWSWCVGCSYMQLFMAVPMTLLAAVADFGGRRYHRFIPFNFFLSLAAPHLHGKYYKCGNWDWGRAIPFLGTHKSKFLCSAQLCLVRLFSLINMTRKGSPALKYIKYIITLSRVVTILELRIKNLTLFWLSKDAIPCLVWGPISLKL